MALQIQIKKNEVQAVGSLQSIKFIPQRALANMLQYSRHRGEVINTVAINNQVVADWIEIYSSQDKFELSENQTTDSKGSYYAVSISFFVPENNNDLLDLLKLLHQAKIIALVKDLRNVDYLIGNKLQALNMKADFSKPMMVDNTSGYRVTFSGNFSERIPIYKPL